MPKKTSVWDIEKFKLLKLSVVLHPAFLETTGFLKPEEKSLRARYFRLRRAVFFKTAESAAQLEKLNRESCSAITIIYGSTVSEEAEARNARKNEVCDAWAAQLRSLREASEAKTVKDILEAEGIFGYVSLRADYPEILFRVLKEGSVLAVLRYFVPAVKIQKRKGLDNGTEEAIKAAESIRKPT